MNGHKGISRSQKGMGTIELAAASFALLILVLVVIDICFLLLGNQVLDRAARDAARAAGSQSTLANAINAANAALKMHETDGTFISQPTLTSTSAPDFVFQDYAGTPYGATIPQGQPGAGTTALNPTVTVTSTLQVMLPASFAVLGVHIDQGPLTGGKMTFKRTYTFPIVRQELNPAFNG